jgi:hypothetical protein
LCKLCLHSFTVKLLFRVIRSARRRICLRSCGNAVTITRAADLAADNPADRFGGAMPNLVATVT